MDIFISSVFYEEFRNTPIKLIDVGASGGLQDNWKAASRFLEVVGFEPDRRAYEELKRMGGVYINSALSSKKKKIDFFLTKEQRVSSTYRPNREFLNKFPEAERFDVLKTESIACDNLDNQLKNNGIEDIDFIKLDTQGSELEILLGAVKTIDSVFGLEIEVEFNSIYKGQPLFSDVDKLVREHGFQLFDIKPYYWKRKKGMRCGKGKGQLIFADALYFKRTELLRISKSKILRAMAICLLYGYVDYAFEIYEFFNNTQSVFSEFETSSIDKFFDKQKYKIPNFRGRGKVANILEGIVEDLKPNYNGWARSTRKIGNL